MPAFPWKYQLSDHSCAIEAGDLLNKYTNCPGTPLQIEAVTDSTLRIHARTQKSFAVETAPSSTGTLQLVEAASGDSAETSVLVLATDSLRITIDDALHLQISSSDGTVLCSDYTGPLQEAESLTEEEIEQMRQEGHVVHAGDDACRFQITKKLFGDEAFYGLGDKTGFLNKIGYDYTMWNTDNPDPHVENPTFKALYKSIPFFIALRNDCVYGIFFDNHFKTNFDMGYSSTDYYSFGAADGELDYYFFYGDTIADIISQYTALTGRCPLPQLWTLGYHQSRWGYSSQQEVLDLAQNFIDNDLPCDVIHMDIDYMDNYKVFTVDKNRFPDLTALSDILHQKGIRLVTIIDPGTKVENGYHMYEEGIKNNYFAQTPDGEVYENVVWPGDSVFPDYTSSIVRNWWGSQTKFLLNQGISGIWNDMNEPAIFYTPEGVCEVKEAMREFIDKEESVDDVWGIRDMVADLANNAKDYASMYHNMNGKMVRHDQVHNLFGYNMTRAAGEALREICPEKRCLLFSRSSYIGMHRYGGIWTGDNKSWWSHILLNLKMLPSLNMCGFLYTGADLGGFGADTTRELLLRFLALGVFTPLMRNHSATGTREQECYQFENIEDFRAVINTRYRLVPYLYSEYMKAALSDDMYFKPLGFVYPDDKRAIRVEDQLMLGNEIMIAPVYEQNARGRYVYLPEEMKFVKFLPDGSISEEILAKGIHYVDVASNEVPLFIRNGKCIPVAEAAECVKDIDTEHLQLIGYENSSYTMYEDDGIRKDYDKKENYRVFTN